MTDRRVLVTGATGFVGCHTLPALRARGFAIHVVGRTAPADPGVIFHEADLLDPAARRAAVSAARASHLLHLAWYAEPGLYWTSGKNLDWVAGSLGLVRAFREAGGRRAVVAGTCAEYEWGAARFHETETPCRPATLYGAAKDGLRRILAAYAATTGLSLAWGRLFHLYGPGERPGRLISDAARALLSGTVFPTSDGRQRRDFLHVTDAAAALATLLDGEVEGPVNLGSGRAVPVRALLEGIAAETGRPGLIGFGARDLNPGEPSVIEADVRRLSEEVGLRPSYDLERGLAETVAWWRARLSRSASGA